MVPASSTLMIFLLFYICRPTLAQRPHEVTWSAEPLGPDGPWNAVQVAVGGQDEISLFPGRMFSSFVTTTDYCAVNNSIPHCASGTYLKDYVGGRRTRPIRQDKLQAAGSRVDPGDRDPGVHELL